MENVIKGVAKLQGIVTQDQLEKLEFGAKLHKRHSRVEFKILSAGEHEIIIESRQGKSPNGNHFEASRLIEIAKEWIDPFVEQVVHVRPKAYIQAVVDIVNSEWILKEMLRYHISLKQLCVDTGVDKTSMSAYVNGHKPLSQTVKSMFYYYFVNVGNLLFYDFDRGLQIAQDYGIPKYFLFRIDHLKNLYEKIYNVDIEVSESNDHFKLIVNNKTP